MGKIFGNIIFISATAYLGLCSSLLGNVDKLQEINRVVAKVNGRIITWGEIERKMDQLNFSEREKKQRAEDFVNGEVDKFLSIDAFDEQGMAIPQAYIEQEYNKKLLQNFNGNRRLFRDVLQSNGQSQLEYREQIKQNIIHMHMLAKRKRSKEEISPAKVEAFYLANQDKFRTERKIRISEIVLSDDGNNLAKKEIEKKALFLRSKIKNAQDFTKIAKEYGQSTFKENAGDWGVMIKRSELRNAVIRDRSFALKKGEISEPFAIEQLVRLDDGTVAKSGKVAYYIILVSDESPAGVLPIEDVRLDIERMLISQIDTQEQNKWLAQRKRDSYVVIDLPE